MKVQISSSEYYLPQTKEDNESLRQDNPNWDMLKIEEKTGIHKRSIASPEQTALDLALIASNKLLESVSCKEEID